MPSAQLEHNYAQTHKPNKTKWNNKENDEIEWLRWLIYDEKIVLICIYLC